MSISVQKIMHMIEYFENHSLKENIKKYPIFFFGLLVDAIGILLIFLGFNGARQGFIVFVIGMIITLVGIIFPFLDDSI